MDGNRAATVAGFAGALAVLAVLVWVVGVDRTVSALLTADPAVLVLVVAVAAAWLTTWGLALWSVLRALGSPVHSHLAVLVYAGAVFSNNVTPFGQAGGEPLSALLISSAADSEYETGLAAIASVDTAHFVPSVGFAIAGFTFVTAGAVQLGRNLAFAAAAVAALAVGLPVAAFVGWRYRYELEATVVRLLTPVIRWLGHTVPKWSPPTAASIQARIESFFAAIDRIATDRRTLLQTLGFSALGWACLAGSLWLSLYAVGYTVPVATTFLVVPVGSIASLAPLPGGSGAIETVLVTLLVSTTAVPGAVAASAVLIHRGATYLLPTLLGAGVASALGADHATASARE
ncbi:flippase-like domain-containing protein [Haloarcula sp. S1CR25-12]|uniref:Flippase-like domain-containing protein n=1 Tax=Haloarcula saliterrae TaxID=2950534 RepID=A0ABU2FC37_9EURY|nr:lysylphosphatidylglycerol synthase transmembrane domain-containing protein [Haloarcula sp. S1CR25-12]MDS0259829.1 flippase-like domain-containing protein [Haloarcula sp. S1CR25-12]